ncbi:XRE family transcriptional regulator [Halomonas venusta]|uniref:helix-turn-helix domain-containing protein n=1 Tax=Vreelandella venusta TaxID=44935 RepID=UPI00295EE0C2|nr:XRE family transcriptional regulator [Halomonas venusta]MDW0357765.1 XRE family transcriptional regulator [Halomonas venusta]
MFSIESLETARERRGFTKKALAEKAGTTPEHLTRIIKGKHIPEDELVTALAKALNYPKKFLMSELAEQISHENVSFRNLSALTAKDRKRAVQAGNIAMSVNRWMSSTFQLPTFDLPDNRFEDPITAADSLRSYWGIGNRPIPNLLKLLEIKGVRVFALDEDNYRVDAYSFYSNSQPYIMLNNTKSAERSRFNLAHELGHLVLHMHSGSHSECDGQLSGSAAEHREQEKEADMFASHLLMPADDVKDHLPRVKNLDHLIEAKKRWRVSVAALARKCYDLGIVSEWAYRSLCQEISVRGYRTKEPDEIERERSALLEKVIAFLFSQKKSLSYLAQEVMLPVDEVDTIIQGVLSNNMKNKGFGKRGGKRLHSVQSS